MLQDFGVAGARSSALPTDKAFRGHGGSSTCVCSHFYPRPRADGGLAQAAGPRALAPGAPRGPSLRFPGELKRLARAGDWVPAPQHGALGLGR